MTLVKLANVLAEASRDARGVGAFNVIQIEHAEALVSAAEETGLPVVLQISENADCARHQSDCGGVIRPVCAAPRPRRERGTRR